MSHDEQRRFIAGVAEYLPEFFVGTRVLEIGSLDVNGSIRSFFVDCDYKGLDVAPGPGVDIVGGGHEFDAPNGSFDVVVSVETMEHNPYWIETVGNMLRLCREGGLILITCASLGRVEHGTTRSDPQSSPLTIGLGWDYYRNVSEVDMRRAVASAGHQILAGYWTNWRNHDLYMAAVKGTPSRDTSQQFALMCNEVDAAVGSKNRAARPRVKRLLLARRGGESLLALMRRLRR